MQSREILNVTTACVRRAEKLLLCMLQLPPKPRPQPLFYLLKTRWCFTTQFIRWARAVTLLFINYLTAVLRKLTFCSGCQIRPCFDPFLPEILFMAVLCVAIVKCQESRGLDRRKLQRRRWGRGRAYSLRLYMILWQKLACVFCGHGKKNNIF